MTPDAASHAMASAASPAANSPSDRLGITTSSFAPCRGRREGYVCAGSGDQRTPSDASSPVCRASSRDRRCGGPIAARSAFEDEERDLAPASPAVRRVRGPHLIELGPEGRPLFECRRTRAVFGLIAADPHTGVWVGLEVASPARLRRPAPVRAGDDQARAVADVEEWCRSRPARCAADGREQQRGKDAARGEASGALEGEPIDAVRDARAEGGEPPSVAEGADQAHQLPPPPPPPPPPEPPPPPPPENPLDPPPPGVVTSALDSVDENDCIEPERPIALSADPSYHPAVARWMSSPANAFAHFVTRPNTIAYGR